MTSHSSLASVRATAGRLAELGLSTKKHLGQHFLVDDGVVGRILRLATPIQGRRIVEVGPGIGTLTEALLAAGADLTLVELDAALLNGLAERYPKAQLIGADAIAHTTIERLQQLAPTDLVANLPYAVAATLILTYFQALPGLASATVMVQHEVAERIMAVPGNKDYGAYTVKLRLLAKEAGHFNVPPQCFYPPPRVESTVVRLERQESEEHRGTVLLCPTLRQRQRPGRVRQDTKEPSPCVPPEPPQCFTLITTASMLADAAFYQRRKTIRNSMRAYVAEQGLPLPAAATPAAATEGATAMVDSLLAAASIPPTARGETLPPKAFLALARAYEAYQGTVLCLMPQNYAKSGLPEARKCSMSASALESDS
jgi:16S rRNA (adenine1518-N6/adenine1519-N6)-dimethyltransferase